MKPKQVVAEFLGNEGLSVRRGRGTAQSWLYIKTNKPVDDHTKSVIERTLVELGHCGTYLTDQPGVEERDAQVLWECPTMNTVRAAGGHLTHLKDSRFNHSLCGHEPKSNPNVHRRGRARWIRVSSVTTCEKCLRRAFG